MISSNLKRCMKRHYRSGGKGSCIGGCLHKRSFITMICRLMMGKKLIKSMEASRSINSMEMEGMREVSFRVSLMIRIKE